jgi:hypothetical protein
MEPKKPYVAPALTRHGGIDELTQGTSGPNAQDGASLHA